MHTARKVLGAGCWVLACAWQTSWCAATTAPLAIVNPTVSDRDGGAAVPGSYPHDPGETMFFSFQVAGYTASSGDRVHLTYKIDAVDPKGVPLMEPVAAEIEETLAPEDKNWKPTVRHEIIIPPLAGSGTYKIAISVTDLISKATAAKEVPFEVHGRPVEPSDKLTIRNIRFYRGEEDKEPLLKAAYRPGEAVWARFDIIGYKYGDGNAIDVSYKVSVLLPNGIVIYTQPEESTERSQAFYPKRYVPASFNLSTRKDTRAGEYTIAISVHDAVGNQTYEARQSFTIE